MPASRKHKATTDSARSPKHRAERLNICIDPAYQSIAKAYLPNTRHKSLSKFFEWALKQLLKKEAANLRKMGIKIPDELLTKAAAR